MLTEHRVDTTEVTRWWSSLANLVSWGCRRWCPLPWAPICQSHQWDDLADRDSLRGGRRWNTVQWLSSHIQQQKMQVPVLSKQDQHNQSGEPSAKFDRNFFSGLQICYRISENFVSPCHACQKFLNNWSDNFSPLIHLLFRRYSSSTEHLTWNCVKA